MKAPGPYGMHGLFYKKYWYIVGGQVVEAVRKFFIQGWMFNDMNHTFITLIPKT